MSGLCKGLFSSLVDSALSSKVIVLFCFFFVILGSESGALVGATKRVILAAFTCSLALGGTILGIIHGAIKGQTMMPLEAGISGLSGAIAAIQLMDSVVEGSRLSKVALLSGMVNGKIFMEWVSSAFLKAHQWQVSTLETTYREISDFYDIVDVKGLSHECIQNLPWSRFHSSSESCNELLCSICLQELEDGECIRELPICGHYFHMACIDQWLRQQSTCPMCRVDVCSDRAII